MGVGGKRVFRAAGGLYALWRSHLPLQRRAHTLRQDRVPHSVLFHHNLNTDPTYKLRSHVKVFTLPVQRNIKNLTSLKLLRCWICGGLFFFVSAGLRWFAAGCVDLEGPTGSVLGWRWTPETGPAATVSRLQTGKVWQTDLLDNEHNITHII